MMEKEVEKKTDVGHILCTSKQTKNYKLNRGGGEGKHPVAHLIVYYCRMLSTVRSFKSECPVRH